MRWLLLYILAISNYVKPQQRIIEGPVNTSVLLGGTVILKCRVESQKGAVQWMKNGFGLGNDYNLSLFKRYTMEGQVSKGEYNLRIINVQMNDDDEYACQIEAAHNSPTVLSSTAKLTVLVKPEDPKLLSVESVLKGVVGQLTQQSCISRYGKPLAIISWVISDDPKATKILTWLGNTNTKFNANSGIIYNIFAPRVKDDGKYLVCVVNHETYSKPQIHAVQFDLRYSPDVKVVVNDSNLREHGSAELLCNIKAKPFKNVKIKWYENGKEIDRLSIPELKVDHHQSRYTCVAENSIGDSSDSIILNVTYGAYIISREQHQAVNPGETASFVCEAIGNPAPAVHWTKVADSEVIARGNNLTIESVQSWQRGEYECVATVQGFSSARLINYLHIKGPPSVSMNEDIVAAVGENLEIICEIRGRPQPQDVLWSLNGISFEYGRLGIPRQFGVESRLVIQNVRKSDFGIYNCTAYNELGRDFQTVCLKQKSIVDTIIGTFLIFLDILVVTPSCEAIDCGQYFIDTYHSTANESHELLYVKVK
ncbi:unnamed protein product [Thelazia callipaeda]|uniref:Nephrin n=1 Tax=Thelazia callipaeda TaxID=103827 RepID=A0A158RC64_THECL|nr:unnamed protein product [Thelazia callipaeda]